MTNVRRNHRKKKEAEFLFIVQKLVLLKLMTSFQTNQILHSFMISTARPHFAWLLVPRIFTSNLEKTLSINVHLNSNDTVSHWIFTESLILSYRFRCRLWTILFTCLPPFDNFTTFLQLFIHNFFRHFVFYTRWLDARFYYMKFSHATFLSRLSWAAHTYEGSPWAACRGSKKWTLWGQKWVYWMFYGWNRQRTFQSSIWYQILYQKLTNLKNISFWS